MPKFEFLNPPPNHPKVPEDPTTKGSFDLFAPSKTDIWRKPPATDDLNAPAMVTTTKSFRSARVTLKVADSRKYDQGGLLLLLSGDGSGPRRWVKAGVEFAEPGEPYVAAVATDRFSDWSLVQVDSAKATILMEREGVSLWIYEVKQDGSRKPLREVTWVFASAEPAEVQIGVYAARPTVVGPQERDSSLLVMFYDFQITED